MNSPQETNAIETGRMEFPALVIHTVKGEPVSCDIVRSDSDSWIGSYPVGKLGVHTHVISLSTILRAQAMERALEDCQTPEDDSAFMDDNKGERARAHLRSINRIARHALKGTVTA